MSDIMLVICGRMFKIVSIRSLIAIEAFTSLKILRIRKPRMMDVVEAIPSPEPIIFIKMPKFVPKTMKQSNTFHP